MVDTFTYLNDLQVLDFLKILCYLIFVGLCFIITMNILVITILDQVANFRLRVYTMKRVDADLKRKDELKAALNIDNDYEQED